MNPSETHQTSVREHNGAEQSTSETSAPPLPPATVTDEATVADEVASRSSMSTAESLTSPGRAPSETPHVAPDVVASSPAAEGDPPASLGELDTTVSKGEANPNAESSTATTPSREEKVTGTEYPTGPDSVGLSAATSTVEPEQTASSLSDSSSPAETTAGVPNIAPPVATHETVTQATGTADTTLTAATETTEIAGPPKESRTGEAARPTPPPRPPQPIPPVPAAPQPHDLTRIAQDLQIRKSQVEAVLHLLDDNYAPPFIARYRKDQTGGLSEETIRRIQQRVRQLREIAARKQSILRTLARRHQLTEELTQAILQADTLERLEDLFLPFRPKKKSPATEARAKGLAPVAEAIWNRDPAVAHLEEVLAGLVDPDKWLLTPDDVLNGIKLILKEMVAEHPDLRGEVRKYLWETGVLVAQRVETLPEGKGKEFQPYFNFQEAVRDIPPHRILAITRGERLNILRVHIRVDRNHVVEMALQKLAWNDHPHRDLLMSVTAASVEEILLPTLEKELRRRLLQQAQEHAVQIFARNLRSLLLQPPLRGKKVLAIDPSNRNTTHVVVLLEDGGYVEDAVIHVSGPHRNPVYAKRRLEQLIRRHQVSCIAIGNGGNYREVEALVSELIADLDRGGGKSLSAPSASGTAAPPGPAVHTPATPAAAESHTTSETRTIQPKPKVVLTSEMSAPSAPTPETSVTAAVITVHPPEVAFTTTVIASAPSVPVPPSIVNVPNSSEDTSTPGPSTSESVTISAPSAVAIESVGPAPTEKALITTTTSLPLGGPEAASPAVAPIDLEGLPPAPSDLAYAIVIESGIREYAHSPIAQEEFPTLSPAIRAAISIGRRLLDPLAELVKIDPHLIGVGLYQHDVKPKYLKEALEAVVVSTVNAVGVDLNRAEYPLLRYVCGLNPTFAREILTHRRQHGPFRHRRQLLEISGLTEKHYTQAAGFIKICDGDEPLDGVWIHPEQYDLARAILEACHFNPGDLRDSQRVAELPQLLAGLSPTDFASRFHVSEGTVRDVMHALAHPGRDPRLDHPPPLLKRGMLKFEDIHPGMELRGTVLNVVPFGAFVDIGLRESGLVHISQMANRYIRSPYEVVAVGDAVTVWVLDIKPEARKISLTMIPPGQERRSPTPTGEKQPSIRERREGATSSAPSRGGPTRSTRAERGRRPQVPPPSGGRSTSAEAKSPRTHRRQRPLSPGQQQAAATQASQAPAESAEHPSTPPTAAAPETPAQQTPPPSTATPSASPPRRSAKAPAKAKPLPILPPEKRSGKAALNTFAELAAFFQQHQESPPQMQENASGSDSTSSSSTEATTAPTTPTPTEDPNLRSS